MNYFLNWAKEQDDILMNLRDSYYSVAVSNTPAKVETVKEDTTEYLLISEENTGQITSNILRQLAENQEITDEGNESSGDRGNNTKHDGESIDGIELNKETLRLLPRPSLTGG